MFRVALILFKHTLRSDVLPECPSLYETMERLRHIPPEYMQEEFIVREVRKCTPPLLYMSSDSHDPICLMLPANYMVPTWHMHGTRQSLAKQHEAFHKHCQEIIKQVPSICQLLGSQHQTDCLTEGDVGLEEKCNFVYCSCCSDLAIHALFLDYRYNNAVAVGISSNLAPPPLLRRLAYIVVFLL